MANTKIDVEGAGAMGEKFNSVRTLNSKCCIYAVPEFLKKGKRAFYEPLVVSIGPAHYNKKNLQKMQRYKWNYLHSFLHHPNISSRKLNDYINTVRALIEDIRGCYDESLMESCNDDEFIEVMVLDAVFLLGLFLSVRGGMGCQLDYQPNFDIPDKLLDSLNYMRSDIFLVQNQLPFFVIRRIYGIAFPDHPRTFVFLTRRFIKFFGGYLGSDFVATVEIDDPNIKHLLDYWRNACSTSLGVKATNGKLVEYPRTAKQLSAAGVKFIKSESLNPLDITFDSNDGKLCIPQITIYKGTETFLRNLLYFEQCQEFHKRRIYFIDLMYFLDSLIDTAEDIALLKENGILRNIIGSDNKAADFFNNIKKDFYGRATHNHFSDISENVNEYASKQWNQWMAALKTEYFYSPWSYIAVGYAVIMFVLTAIQAINSFIKN